MVDGRLLGDLRERADGGFDGWCWAPEHPDQRMVVDLMVDDVLAVSMVAAVFRRDLLTQGYGDGRHGFAMRLPAHLSGIPSEQLITARERHTGAVFGRVLRKPAATLPVGGERLQRLDLDVAELCQDVANAQIVQGEPLPSVRWREALGELAGHLALRAAHAHPNQPLPPGLAAGARSGPKLVLPDPLAPALSLVLLGADAATAQRQIAALAPALGDIDADVTLVDPGHDLVCMRLPARLRNLRYVRAWPGCAPAEALALASATATGRWLLLLDGQVAEPSAAGLLALARIVTPAAPALWLGPEAMQALSLLGEAPGIANRLPGRLGVTVCIARDMLEALDLQDAALSDGAGLEWADLAFKARLLGLPVFGLAEPLPFAAPPTAAPPAYIQRSAHAAFNARWGGITAKVLDRAGGAA